MKQRLLGDIVCLVFKGGVASVKSKDESALLSDLVSRCKGKRNISIPDRCTPTCLEATCSSGVDKKDAYLAGE